MRIDLIGSKNAFLLAVASVALTGCTDTIDTATGESALDGFALIGPSGTTADQYPAFSWSAPGSVGPYRLWIDGYYDATFTEAQLACVGGGTCTSPNIFLPENITTDWWVYAEGAAEWTGPLYFTTGSGSPVPPPPVLLGPSGSSPNSGPVFTWQAAAAADTYRLWIDGLYDNTFAAADLGCSTGTCTTASIPLPASANAVWFVHASNTLGGNWSSSMSFTVGPMAAATPLAPSGGTSADTGPVFTWTAAPAATSYRLWIDGLYDSTFSAASLGCAGGGTCTTGQILLPAGATAQWYVGAQSPYDFAWSSVGYFFVVGSTPPAPSAPVQIGPAGGTSATSGPQFSWTGSSVATSYRLWIADLYDASFTPAQCGCPSGGTCTTPAISLPAGATAHWFVNASNATGNSWSTGPSGTGMTFTVGSLPAATNQIGPSGSATSSEVFSFTPTLDAASYRVWIDSNWDATYTPTELGCETGTCATPAITVSSGTWSWFVETTNGFGSTWSNGKVIVVP